MDLAQENTCFSSEHYTGMEMPDLGALACFEEWQVPSAIMALLRADRLLQARASIPVGGTC